MFGIREPFKEFSTETYDHFNTIIKLARDLNIRIKTPEFVFVGSIGSDKIGIIEAFLGHTIWKGKKTKRPIELRLINNPECVDPKVTLKRDSFLVSNGKVEGCDKDLEIPIDELGDELQKRNSTTSIPIYVNYEYQLCWNMTLVHSPVMSTPKKGKKESNTPRGLEGSISDSSSSTNTAKKKLLSTTQNLIKPAPHRHIVCVEAAGSNDTFALDIIHDVYPRMDKTLFVFSKFHKYLETLTTTDMVNKYFSSLETLTHGGKWFVGSVASNKKTLNYSNRAAFRSGLAKCISRDKDLLESLTYDRRNERSIGIFAVRNHILDTCWKAYQDRIPEILESLAERKKNSQAALMTVRNEISNLESYKLRTTATTYAMDFLKNVEKLISGTIEGAPSQNGQSLKEETSYEFGYGPWLDSDYKSIKIKAKKWGVPFADMRLYGRQQFERLLSQFRGISTHTLIGVITTDDVACSAGPNKISTATNVARAASDIAQKRSLNMLRPLIDQLHERALYIMKRLVDIVDKMMEVEERKNRAASTRSSGGNRHQYGASVRVEGETKASNFPYFTNIVREIYFDFVDNVGKQTKEMCADEFLCTKIIHWDLVNLSGYTLPKDTHKMHLREQQEEVISLATKLFDDIRTRITNNVLLKYYNYFFLPIQQDLWGAVQGRFTTISDEKIAELFQTDANKITYQLREKDTEKEWRRLQEMEGVFMEAANKFSHP